MPVDPPGGAPSPPDPRVAACVAAYVKLLRATKSVIAHIEPLLAAEGLTPTQLGVLEAVMHLGPLTQRELGRKVLTSAGNLSDVVDKLVRRGLVRRARDPNDRRLARVELTDAGATLIQRIFPAHAADIAEAMTGLDQGDLEILGGLLRRLGTAAAAQTAARAAADAGQKREA